jgi:hypothetical protein
VKSGFPSQLARTVETIFSKWEILGNPGQSIPISDYSLEKERERRSAGSRTNCASHNPRPRCASRDPFAQHFLKRPALALGQRSYFSLAIADSIASALRHSRR